MKHYEFVAKNHQGTLVEGEINAVSMTDAKTALLTGDYKQVFFLKESEIIIDEDKLESALRKFTEDHPSHAFSDAEISFIAAAVHKAQNPFTRQRKPKAD